MEKEIVSYQKTLGGDGATVEGALGIEGENLRAEIAFEYPVAKVVEPVMKVVDGLVDKIEQWIPGDQKALAEKLKDEARKELMDLIKKELAKA